MRWTFEVLPTEKTERMEAWTNTEHGESDNRGFRQGSISPLLVSKRVDMATVRPFDWR